jgi:transposase, IS5 family
MRVDTTVVETNIHYPTDSSLLGDGNRVLTRLMKKVRALAGAVGAKLRDRSRSVKLRVLDIARAARSKATQSQEKMKQAYCKLLTSIGRVVGQAKRFSKEIANGVKRSAGILQQAALEGLRREIDTMVPRVQQVIKQTQARVFKGNTHAEGKLFSIFETSTEIIRKGKAGKPNEFGKIVKVQEAEGQIITDFEVYDERPADSDVLIPAIEIHQQLTGRTPEMAAGDAGFYSVENQPSRALGRGVRDQHDRLAIRTWSSFCRSAVIQTQSDQIGDIRFAHAHDRICAAPIDLHGSIGLRNGATGEHDVVDVSRDFPGIFRLQNPRVAHSDDLRWVQ